VGPLKVLRSLPAAGSGVTGRTQPNRLSGAVARVNPTVVGIALAIAIATLVAFGIVDYYVQSMPGFWLDGEHNVPATFSALVLVFTAVTALALAGNYEKGTPMRRYVVGLAAFFAFMSLDEYNYFHEHFNDHFGIPWQLPYIPLLLVAGYLAWNLFEELEYYPPSAAMFAGGAGAWGLAQIFDLYQVTVLDTDNTLTAFTATVVAEEGLEMAGSVLFALALLTALRQRLRAPQVAPS
jgi:hypothetical protein